MQCSNDNSEFLARKRKNRKFNILLVLGMLIALYGIFTLFFVFGNIGEEPENEFSPVTKFSEKSEVLRKPLIKERTLKEELIYTASLARFFDANIRWSYQEKHLKELKLARIEVYLMIVSLEKSDNKSVLIAIKEAKANELISIADSERVMTVLAEELKKDNIKLSKKQHSIMYSVTRYM